MIQLFFPVQLHQQIKETLVINYRAAKRIITGCQDYNPPLKDYNALYYCTSFEILVGRYYDYILLVQVPFLFLVCKSCNKIYYRTSFEILVGWY